MKLFVDDIRIAPQGFILAKTISEAVRILDDFHVGIVSLDHDITYQDERGAFTGKVSPEDFSTVARFIRRLPVDQMPHTVYVHTANPDGAQRIFGLLKGLPIAVIRETTYSHEWLTIPMDIDDGEIPAKTE